jgi:hypothetical protein
LLVPAATAAAPLSPNKTFDFDLSLTFQVIENSKNKKARIRIKVNQIAAEASKTVSSGLVY